ncbi:8338_t:CDS:2, partial [Racocetra persica]
QHYESGKIPEYDNYSYDDDSVSGPSNFNQEHNISNIKGDEKNEINKMDNTCSKEPDNKNTKDAVNNPI